MKFKWKKILKPKTVVHCKTKGQSDKLAKATEEKGYKILSFDYWEAFRSETCYHFSISGAVSYNDIFSWIRAGYTILKFKDVVKKKKCEWELDDDDHYFITECSDGKGWVAEYDELDFSYCPYCGRKIKLASNN